MISSKYIKTSVCCLGLALIASCAKEQATEPKPSITPVNNEPKPSLPTTSGHIMQLELSTDIDPNLVFDTESRALHFTMLERPSDEAGIKNYRPRLDLQDPANGKELAVPVYAIMAKKGDSKSVFTQEIVFHKKRGTNQLYYSGLISLPEGREFESGSWYMMLLANHNPESSRAQLAPSYTSHTAASYALPVVATYGGRSIGLELNVPYSTEWFLIESSEAGSKHIITKQSFSFKPEGILIQHELIGDLAEAHQLRAVGIRSNTLSFSGYYDVSPQAITTTLNGVTDDSRRIAPTWVATPQRTMELSRVRDNNVFGVATDFPWTMPSLHSGSYQKLHNISPQIASTTKGDHSLQILSPQRSQGQIPQAWEVRGRQYVFFWAMPQSVQQGEQPYTYIYADVMSEVEGRQQSYNVKPELLHSELKNKSQKHSEALDKLNQTYYQAAALRYALNNKPTAQQEQSFKAELTKVEGLLPQMEQAYKTSLDELKVAQTALQTFNDQYMAQVGLSRQNLLVTYATTAQSKADGTGIKTGRIYQTKGLISPDLLITEIVYRHEGSNNYSLVEITNPAQTPRNLKDYALVRLKNEEGYFAYQKEDGSTTVSLNEAKKLPLETLLSNREDKTRFSHIAPARTWNFSDGSLSKYPAQNRFWWNAMSDPTGVMPLYSQQSILLGASGYVTEPIMRVRESSVSTYESYNFQNYRCSYATPWFADWLGATAYTTAEMPQPNQANKLLALMQSARLRYMAAYDDATEVGSGRGTLDLARGEGLALIKKNSSGSWYIIDSSVPAGRRSWFSPMDFNGYQRLIATQPGNFSLQRRDFINFPTIPPYRSAAVAGQGGEWVAKPIAEHTLGHRGKTSTVRYQYDELWSLQHSMLSPTKRPVAPTIPVR